MNTAQVTLLCLFYDIAAFDRVDHNILTHSILVRFGISSEPLDWLRSFLDGYTSCTVFWSTRSHLVATLLLLFSAYCCRPYIIFSALLTLKLSGPPVVF